MKSRVPADKLWKSIIEDLFEDFLFLTLPELAKLVDFEKGFQFLDKELDVLFPKGAKNNRFVDKLAKIYLSSGEERWVLVHIEIQGYEDVHFAKRMFAYFYRIYDKYDQPITAIAIFTEDDPNFKPTVFEYNFFGTSVQYRYNTYKVLEQQEQELITHPNPFSLVILAALYALRKDTNTERLYSFKVNLARLCTGRGYDRKRRNNLINFIKFILFLPEQIDLQFDTDVKQLTGKSESMGIEETIIEHFKQEARKEGRREERKELLQQAREEKIEMAKKMLTLGIQREVVQEITRLPANVIEKLIQANNT